MAEYPGPYRITDPNVAEQKRRLVAELGTLKRETLDREQFLAGQEQREAERIAQSDRTGTELLADGSLAIGRTTANLGLGVVGLAHQAQSMVNPFSYTETGRNIDNRIQEGLTGATEAVDQYLGQYMSRVSQLNQAQVAQSIEDQAAQSQAQYEQALADGANPLAAGAQRVGRDFVDAARETLRNPTVMFDTVVGQVPTLAAGLGARAAVTGGQVAARAGALSQNSTAMARAQLLAQQSGREVGEVLQDMATRQLAVRNLGVGVGAMEGGGAFSEASAEIQGMPFEDLARRYPQFQQAVADGASPEAARTQLARQVGLVAGAGTAVVTGGISRLAPDFDLAPLSAGFRRTTAGGAVGNILERVGNVAKETVEESLQSGIGAASQNVGQTLSGDREADFLAGVGTQAGQGAAGGFGLTAALQAPGMAMGAASGVTNQGLRLFRERAEQAREMAEAPAEATRQQAVADTVRTVQGLDTIATRMKDEAAIPDTLNAPVTDEPLIQAATVEKLGLAPDANSIQLLGQALQALHNQDTPAEDRPELSLFALKKARELRHYAHNELAAKVQEDPERYGQLEGLIQGLVSNPLVTQIEAAVESLSQEELDAEFDALPEQPSTLNALPTEVQALVSRAVELAYASPEKVSSEQIGRVLYQEQHLSPQDVQQLKLVQELAQIRETYQSQLTELRAQNTVTQDIVSQRIQETGWELGGEELRSLSAFTREIAKAATVGDKATTTQLMKSLHRFSNHMATKAEQYNQALDRSWHANNERVELPDYKQLTQDGSLSTDNAWVKANVPGSRRLVQAINADAEVAVNTFNTLQRQFGSLLDTELPVLAPPTPVVIRTPNQEAPRASTATQSQPATRPAASAADRPVSEPTPQAQPAPAAEEPGPAQAPAKPEAATESKPTQSGEDADQPVGRSLPTLLKDRFTGLLRTLGEVTKDSPAGEAYERTNKFLSGFKHRKKPMGLLARSSLQSVRDALRQAVESKDAQPVQALFVEDDAHLAPPAELVHVYQDLFERIPSLVNRLNRALNHRALGRDKSGQQARNHNAQDDAKGWKERFLNGDPLAWNFEDKMSLNVVEQTDGSELKYNDEVAEAMMTAALHWLLKLQEQPVIVDLEAMETTYGDKLSPEVKSLMLHQHYLPNYVEELGRDILELLGLQGRRDMSVNWTEGLPMVLAMDAINILQEQGYLDITRGYLLDEHGERSGVYLSFLDLENGKRSPEVKQLLTDLSFADGKRLEPLTRLLYPERRDLGHFGAPSSNVRDTIDGQFQKLSPEQKKAVKARQTTPHYVNEGFTNFLTVLGFDNFLSLRGKINPDDLDPDTPVYNVAHEEVLRGTFRGVQASFNALQAVYANLQAYALQHKQPDVSQVPVYYDAKMIGNGRISYVQPFNQQSDKLARETITSVRTTLDMTDDRNRAEYFLALAQMLGKKVEKAQSEGLDLTAAEIIKSELDGKYAPVIDSFKAFIQDPSRDASNEIYTRLKNLKPEWNEMELHALWDYANLQLAQGKDLENFTTHVYLEIDGISNGMINGLVLMGMHSLDATMVKQLRQGGVFLGSHTDGTITAQHIAHARNGTPLGGLYENVGQRFKEHAQAYHAKLKKDGDKAQYRAGIYLMKAINYLTVEELGRAIVLNEVKREPGKAMLMPTVYGSGARSLVKLVAETILNKTYENLSTGLTNNEALPLAQQRALARLIPSLDTNALADPKRYRDFLFTPQNLKDLIQNLYGTQAQPKAGLALVEAAQAELAPVLDTFRHVIALSGAKSYLFARAYKKAYEALRQQRIQEGKLGLYEALSRDDEEAAYNQVKDLAPIVQTAVTGTGSRDTGLDTSKTSRRAAFKVRTAKGRERTVELRSIMGGDMHMEIPALQIEAPGVRSVALSVQALGDATMMSILEQTWAHGTNQVYDGWNVSPGQFQKLGPEANQAVLQSYQFNGLQAVHEGMTFDLALLEELSDQELAEFLAFTKIKTKSEKPAEQRAEVLEHLQSADAQLGLLAQRNAAVQKAVFGGQIQTSVDQMAGPQTPAQTAGVEIAGTDAEIAEQINALAHGGVNTRSGADIKAALKQTPFQNKLHRAVYNQIKSLIPDDLEIYTGDQAAIQAKQQELLPNETIKPAAGVTAGKRIFLTNASEATLLHELVHASTMHLVNGYYAKTGKLNTTQMAAVKRLEVLARDFVTRDLDNHPAQTVVFHLFDTGKTADAVNEFVAWSLTSPELAQRLWKEAPNSLLRRMAARARDYVRQLLGLGKQAEVDNFLAQTIDQVHKLTKTARMPEYEADGSLLYQSNPSPLQEQLDQFQAVIGAVAMHGPLGKENVKVELATAQLESTRAQQRLNDAGFALSPEQEQVFGSWYSLMAADLGLDAGLLIGFQQLYDAAADQLGWEAFLNAPDTSDPVAVKQAQAQHAAVFDSEGDMLATFVGLAQAHDGFRQALASLRLPKKAGKGRNFDDTLRQLAEKSLDVLHGKSLGLDTSATLDQNLRALSERLVQTQQRAKRRSERQPSLLERAENQMLAGLAKVGEQARKRRKEGNELTTVDMWVNGLLMGVQGLTSNTGAQAVGHTLVSLANQEQVPSWIRDLVTELVGNTGGVEAPLVSLLTRSRAMVSRARQRLRVEGAERIRGLFGDLSEADWGRMHRVAIQTDLPALLDGYSLRQIRKWVDDPTARAREIAKLESQLGPHQARYVEAADNLAHWLMKQENISKGFLYSNAEAMAQLLGSGVKVEADAARKLVPVLDRLVSLKTLAHLSDTEAEFLSQRLEQDSDGMGRTLQLLKFLAQAERTKPHADRQQFNYWKGYAPVSNDPRSNLVLTDAVQGAKLLKLGYRQVGKYQGDPADSQKDLAYYAIDMAGNKASYTQGALQIVEGTINGVDQFTGQSLGPNLSTRITDRRTVNAITARKRLNQGQGTANLRPIFNEAGELYAYERVVDPALIAQHMKFKPDLADSVGAWLGRQTEELIAREINSQAIRAMKQAWDQERKEKADEYVDIASSRDPVIRESWTSLPREVQKELLSVFGPKVMVRRNLVNLTVGYRAASTEDIFTGLSRLHPQVRAKLETAAYGLLGKDAAKYLKVTEQAAETLVRTAADFIVVRSLRVAYINLMANQFQLLATGIPLSQLITGQLRKLREAMVYLRNEKRINQLVIDIGGETDPTKRAALEREQARIRQANQRLSIMPLIEAGELTTITEGLSEVDDYTFASDFAGWLQRKTKDMPKELTTLGKYAVISKDTALYQGVNRTIQLGDFIAKAMVYDHLQAQGVDQATALREVNETFVNYNLPAGRTRDWFNKVGLTWFWHYKIRMQKIILRTARNNPLRFLLGNLGAEASGVDSLMDTNAVFNNWEYSLGPGQGLRAHELLFWRQLMGI